MEITREEDSGRNSQSWWSRWIPWKRGHGIDPKSRSPAKDTAGPGAEADTTGMGRGWRPSRRGETVGPMPDTYGYRSIRPEPGNGGQGRHRGARARPARGAWMDG